MEKLPDLLKSSIYEVVLIGKIDEVEVHIPFATMGDAFLYAEHLGFCARKGSQISLILLRGGIPVGKVDSSHAQYQ